jgi:UDP-N-acetylmuramoyl-L-alanyl-D-glutamate--2,6-diaminopimelate ligase
MSPFKTQKFLRACVKKKIEYVVIEASSHALHQSRLWGIPFRVAVITNITHEHLDYHGTMEKYAKAKKILFKKTSDVFVLNTADQFYEKFNILHCPLKIPYGFDEGELQASAVTYSKYGSKFALSYRSDTVGINLPLAGGFNVENAMAATGAALACKLSLDDIKHALETFEGVGGRIIGLIGSCGDRDREKRPVMGEIVAKYCDLTIVTDEEPYSEDPEKIMEAVLKGAKKVKKMGKDLLLIEDRYEAMEHAVKTARPGDLVVITGMGSFNTRTLNSGPIPWDDREVARELINKYS